jgi:hypothetical protein
MQVVRWTSPAGKRRSLTILTDAEAARYRHVATLALRGRQPAAWSFGVEGAHGRAWHARRTAWGFAVRSALGRADAAIASDIVECYPSIGPRAIRLATGWAGGDPEPLLAFLASAHDAGGTGLPIGPSPSAAIADAVLAIADAESRAAGVAPIRWVDDVVFAGSRRQVARAERAWRIALADLGLRDHEGKRRCIDDRTHAPTASQLTRPGRVIMRSQ